MLLGIAIGIGVTILSFAFLIAIAAVLCPPVKEREIEVRYVDREVIREIRVEKDKPQAIVGPNTTGLDHSPPDAQDKEWLAAEHLERSKQKALLRSRRKGLPRREDDQRPTGFLN